jgi:hypothetical protein
VQRVPGVLLPVCTCLDVLGANAGKDCIKRVLLLCLKGAVAKDVWQVRHVGCEFVKVAARPVSTIHPLLRLTACTVCCHAQRAWTCRTVRQSSI